MGDSGVGEWTWMKKIIVSLVGSILPNSAYRTDKRFPSPAV